MVIMFSKNISCFYVNQSRIYFKTTLTFTANWTLTRVTCSSSSIIDHILGNFPNRLTQQGIWNVELYDHQLIYYTKKITRIRRGGYKQIKFRSFKNYTIGDYAKALIEINFAEYEIFDNVNDGYSNFIHKLMEAIEKVTPVKNKKSQRNFQKCFHS